MQKCREISSFQSWINASDFCRDFVPQVAKERLRELQREVWHEKSGQQIGSPVSLVQDQQVAAQKHHNNDHQQHDPTQILTTKCIYSLQRKISLSLFGAPHQW